MLLLSGIWEGVADEDKSDEGGDGESLASRIDCSELECVGEVLLKAFCSWGMMGGGC